MSAKAWLAAAVLGVAPLLPVSVAADEPFKIGLILPMTGPFASTWDRAG